MTPPPSLQKTAHEAHYGEKDVARFRYHTNPDPTVRYVRDRRLNQCLDSLKVQFGPEVFKMSVLIVCAGVGGEGVFFLNSGFENVTVSDFSENALKIATRLDSRLKTLTLNAEAMNLPDKSYDLVVVHDGLHHLPIPALGFAEMLRTARRAAIVIEPYNGWIGNRLGTEWESTGNEINFVYRWDRRMIEQSVKSYLLKDYRKISVFRIWDHSNLVHGFATRFPKFMKLWIAKAVYLLLRPFNFFGNNMVAIVYKNAP